MNTPKPNYKVSLRSHNNQVKNGNTHIPGINFTNHNYKIWSKPIKRNH